MANLRRVSEWHSLLYAGNLGRFYLRFALRLCPCASCIWLLHPAPIDVPKMVLTLQLALVVFSVHQLAQILHLHSWWSSQLALVVFFLRALAHLLMRILQLALCGGGGACGCIFM